MAGRSRSPLLALAAFCLYVSTMWIFRRGNPPPSVPGGLLRSLKKYLPLAIVLLFLAVPGGIFLFRSPVLIVSDTSFLQLYGPMRLMIKELKLSAGLFRRVITVPVSENAGPDLVALVVNGASRAPRAVFFPSRYLEGARLFRQNRPGVPVFVTGGQKTQRDADLVFIVTDTAQDLFRAGLCASLLAENRKVFFFTDVNFQYQERDAFREGLKTQGFLGEPVFANTQTDYSQYSDVGCVVLAGPATKFLEKNLKIPLILFSWLDPALTPHAVKLVFDDSPWVVAENALKFPPENNEIVIASEVVILRDRMEKKDFRMFQDFVKEKFQKN